MGKLIFIAAAAGLASALLAGAAATGPGLGMLLAALAPLPLMIVGMGWHPLMAALGGAITAAALSAMVRGSAGVIFAVLVMAPAFAAAWLVWRQDVDARMRTGRLVVGGLVYAALATILGALSISLSYDELQAHLLRQSEMVYRLMGGLSPEAPLEPVRGQDPKLFIRTYAQLVAPLSAILMGLILVLNIWVSVRVCEAAGRLPRGRPPVSQMRYPRTVLPAAAIALLGGLLPGYGGLMSELVGVALVLSLILLGFATAHELTRGSGLRGFVLGLLWVTTLLIGLPALAMLFVGVAELVFGWRDRRRAGPSS